MAVSAATLKITPDALSRPANRLTPSAAKAAPATRSPLQRSKIDDRLSLIALAPKAGEIILDLGCGTGRRFSRFMQARSTVIGIDASLAALRFAQKKFSAGLWVLSDTWDALPFVNHHFEAVLSSLSGEHLEHMHSVLHELHRVLKPGGRIVLALHYPVPAPTRQQHAKNHDGVQNNLMEVDFALRTGAFRRTVQDYLSALQAAGFVDIRQHKTRTPGHQQSLFPEETPPPEEFPSLVVLQATRPR
ncbi:MAG: class I SAM-dependent methyltransferase [bacterium]